MRVSHGIDGLENLLTADNPHRDVFTHTRFLEVLLDVVALLVPPVYPRCGGLVDILLGHVS